MDGKSRKEIVIYAGIWISTAVIFLMAVFFAAWYEEQLNRSRVSLLLEKHPELEADIVTVFYREPDKISNLSISRTADFLEEKYGYDYYQRVFHKPVWYLSILFLIIMLSVCYYDYKKNQKRDFLRAELLMKITEQLEQYKKGNFRFIVSSTDFYSKSERNVIWKNTVDILCERLREAGVFFEDLKIRLEEEENATKALITDISHQLKTPISSLHISYELIQSENLSAQERQEFLMQAAQEIDKLEILVKELFQLSRLECSMIQINPQYADIGQTIMEAVNQVYMKAYHKDIEIKMERSQELEDIAVMVSHDRKWTVEAIVNVLDNAVKYSGEHTCIVIRMIKLPVSLLIEVEDEGMGISNSEFHKIYQRFYRGEQARKSAEEGAGVGLYLTRSILEKQGGTISAKRRQKQGMVFRITLPL